MKDSDTAASAAPVLPFPGSGPLASTTAMTPAMPADRLAGCAKSLSQLRHLLRADLYRYAGRTGITAWLRHFALTPGFKYTAWMRTCGWARRKALTRYTLYPFLKWMLLRCQYKYGIAIGETTRIGPGFFINRFGGVYVHRDSVIGCNVNFTHGVVLGYSNRGKNMGAPVLGDRCFLATGAKIIGHVHLGEGVAVGANSVVTKTVPANAVVGGIPARILSEGGTEGYINSQASPEMIARTGWGGIAA